MSQQQIRPVQGISQGQQQNSYLASGTTSYPLQGRQQYQQSAQQLPQYHPQQQQQQHQQQQQQQQQFAQQRHVGMAKFAARPQLQGSQRPEIPYAQAPQAQLPHLARPGSAQQLSQTGPQASFPQAGLGAAAGLRPAMAPLSTAGPRGPANGSVRTTEAIPAPRKYKKRKTPEASSPPTQKVTFQLEQFTESQIFTELQELDRKTQRLIEAQKLEVKYAMRSGEHVRKKLRLYLKSENHSQQSSSEASDPPSWTFKIWGKLVDMLEPVQFGGQPQSLARQSPRLTSLIKRLKVRLSGEVAESSGPRELIWEKDSHKEDHREHFEIKRRGAGEVKIALSLELDSRPPMWLFSDHLARLAGGVKQSTRTAALQGLWAYIRLNKLQESNGQVRCDNLLHAMFKEKSIPLSSLSQRIDAHLTRQQPYQLEYTIRPSGVAEQACYDLELNTPLNPQNAQTLASLDRLAPDPEVERLEIKVNTLIKAAKERVRRRDFLLGFSSSPVDFINGLIASQARDLRTMQKAGQEPTALAMRRTQFFEGKWVEDAVLRYLHRRLAAGA